MSASACTRCMPGSNLNRCYKHGATGVNLYILTKNTVGHQQSQDSRTINIPVTFKNTVDLTHS